MLRYLRTILLLSILYLTGCISHNTPKEYPDYGSGSNFVVEKVDGPLIENLEVLGKVWGYVKYHHPVLGTTRYDADYELFELLPLIAGAEKDERNKILLEWIEDLGEFKLSEKKYRRLESGEDFIMLADLQWIHDTELLGEELSGKLSQLRYANRKSNRYVRPSPAGHPLFDGENEYEHIRWPDKGYQLLSLFRFWNMIEYYSPYRDITDNDWSGILRKYIAEVLTPEADDSRLIAAKYIAELNDTHAAHSQGLSIFSETNHGLLDIKFVQDKLVIFSDLFSNLDELGLTVGTEIIKIDGSPINDIIENVAAYTSFSNKASLLRIAAGRVLATNNDPLSITIMKDGRETSHEIPVLPIRQYNNLRWDLQTNSDPVEPYKFISGENIGYIYGGSLYNKDADSLMTAFSGTKGIIIDMRCYPSDFIIFDFIGKYFVGKSTKHVVFTASNLNLPGTFHTLPESIGRNNTDYYKGKVVVLVNEQTQSAAEYSAMTFQAVRNGVVIGSQTAGADGNISHIKLPGRITITPSFVGVFYPDGTPTQRVGVKIDHYVEPSIQGIKEGRDEVLEYAMDLITKSND